MNPVPATSLPSNLQPQSFVPSAPAQPDPAVRPASWPGAQVPVTIATTDPLSTAELQPCYGAQIVARVGSEPILASDILPEVNQQIDHITKEKGPIPERELPKLREYFFKMLLQQRVQTKLIWLDAKKSLPAEGLAKFEKELGKNFDDVVVESMMKQMNVVSRAELDEKMREMGASLEATRRAYIENMLANEWRKGQTTKKDEKAPTYDEMLTYYRQHIRAYTTPARAQWEELMARFDKHQNNKDATQTAIAQMGNQVVAGAPFAEVAKAGSDGTTAAEGGTKAWTTQGSLVCEALDHAIFNQRVGELSPTILESPLGFHIIRVTQREEVKVKEFPEAQEDIRTKIIEERTSKARREFMEKLKTPVWTKYDSDIANPQLSNRPDRDARRY